MTGVIPSVVNRMDFAAYKQWMWGVFPPIPLDFMICTVRFGNGAAISGTVTMTAHRLMEVLGKLEQIITTGCCVDVRRMITGCCVEVRRTSIWSMAVLPAAPTALRAS